MPLFKVSPSPGGCDEGARNKALTEGGGELKVRPQRIFLAPVRQHHQAFILVNRRHYTVHRLLRLSESLSPSPSVLHKPVALCCGDMFSKGGPGTGLKKGEKAFTWGQVQCHVPIISAFRRLRLEDCEFKGSLGYISKSRLGLATKARLFF